MTINEEIMKSWKTSTILRNFDYAASNPESVEKFRSFLVDFLSEQL